MWRLVPRLRRGCDRGPVSGGGRSSSRGSWHGPRPQRRGYSLPSPSLSPSVSNVSLRSDAEPDASEIEAAKSRPRGTTKRKSAHRSRRRLMVSSRQSKQRRSSRNCCFSGREERLGKAPTLVPVGVSVLPSPSDSAMRARMKSSRGSRYSWRAKRAAAGWR